MNIILAVPNPDFNSSKNWMQGTSTGKLYIQGKKNMVSCPSTQSIDFKENNSQDREVYHIFTGTIPSGN